MVYKWQAASRTLGGNKYILTHFPETLTINTKPDVSVCAGIVLLSSLGVTAKSIAIPVHCRSLVI